MIPFGKDAKNRRLLGTNTQESDQQRAQMQEELTDLLDTWEQENENGSWDIDPILKRMSEILEEAANDFIQNNPDPLDERHPAKTQPHRPFGHLLRIIAKQDRFISKLVISYLARENLERNVLAARLLLNLVQGVDSNLFSDSDSIVPQLFRWAEGSESRELRAYSMALLGTVMDSEQAHQNRKNNAKLIPIALQRLRELYEQMKQNYRKQDEEREKDRMDHAKIGPTNFANLHHQEKPEKMVTEKDTPKEDGLDGEEKKARTLRKRQMKREGGESPPHKRTSSSMAVHAASPSTSSIREAFAFSEGGNSNSSWRQTMQPIIVGTYCLHPLSIEMEQQLILHYLGPTSEYQDNLSIVLENNALGVVINYLAMDGQNHVCRDIRLLFDAIRYISCLLIHRKFAWEFIAAQGIQRLLRINRQSMASTAVTTCLYYLAYSSDIMEKVCHLPDQVVTEMVDYALYALDHNHESGRASIAMFLAYGLQFRAILDRFDQRDGLRRLYNYVSTLTILQRNEEDESDMVDEHLPQSIMTIKNAIFAFRTYLSSHVFLKMEHIKRSQGGVRHSLGGGQHRAAPNIPGGIPNSLHPNSKPMALDEETERGCIDYLIRTQCLLQPHHHTWRPIEEMRSLGVFRVLLNLITNFPEWSHWERSVGKHETLKLLLEVLRLATVSPKVQLDVCETMTVKSTPIQGLGLIIEMAEGEMVNDSHVQRNALEVLVNCVCGPSGKGNGCSGVNYRFSSAFDRDLMPRELALKLVPNQAESAAAAAKLLVTPEQILQMVWKCAQQNNSIMVLTHLLHKQQPATEADSIREIACRALNGIARYEPVRQILSKLPIIAANELNALMQSPVLLEKRNEHTRFCEQARQLIERVSQTKLQDFSTMEMTQENLWRASVVADTHIKFNEKELLQLIYQHLADIGFKKTAKQLQAEAELPSLPASRIPSTPSSLPGFPRQNAASFAKIIARRALKFDTPRVGSVPVSQTPRSQSISRPSTAGGGNRLAVKLVATPTVNSSSSSLAMAMPGSGSSQQAATPAANSSGTAFTLKIRPHKTLSEMVTNYFRNEHAMCRNPVANCPPFSLFYPHRCPEPKLLYSAPTNVVNRLLSRPSPSYRCTAEMLRQADRRLIYSRFRHCKTFSEETETFTCCSFSDSDSHMLLGNYSGEIYVFNVRTGAMEGTMACHHSAITAIVPSKNGLLLTSSAYIKPYSVLWRLEENGFSNQDRLIEFNEDAFVEFGNLSTSQIVGTQGPKATIYDTETAIPVVQLYEERLANHYTRNRAYFDPLDELVLNDGILFDPRIGTSARVVHKFDKLNLDNSGVFHPRGTEVIINSEVWDLRTHRLIHTVPALNQSRVVFNSSGTIIFGTGYQSDDVDERFVHMFGNYFRTFDSNNYQVIATVDTRKPLVNFCAGHTDSLVGLLEMGRSTDEDTNFCKLYEVGRKRDIDEEEEEEQDEQNPEEEEDGFTLGSGSTSSSNEEDEAASNPESMHSGGTSEDEDMLFVAASDESNDVDTSQEQDDAMVEDEDYEYESSDSDFELSSSDYSQ